MEKIITILSNNKTYTPSQVEKQTSLMVESVAYMPSLTEKIISQGINFGLLSNLNLNLVTDNNKYLIYGN
jgi:hypothetical protein